VVRRQRDNQRVFGKSFDPEILVTGRQQHESHGHRPLFDSSHLQHRVQRLDVDLDVTMCFA